MAVYGVTIMGISCLIMKETEKTRLNPIFCDKTPYLKLRKVSGLNRNCSDPSHLLFGIIKSLKSQVFRNCVCQWIAFFVRVLASFNLFATNFRVVHLG